MGNILLEALNRQVAHCHVMIWKRRGMWHLPKGEMGKMWADAVDS